MEQELHLLTPMVLEQDWVVLVALDGEAVTLLIHKALLNLQHLDQMV